MPESPRQKTAALWPRSPPRRVRRSLLHLPARLSATYKGALVPRHFFNSSLDPLSPPSFSYMAGRASGLDALHLPVQGWVLENDGDGVPDFLGSPATWPRDGVRCRITAILLPAPSTNQSYLPISPSGRQCRVSTLTGYLTTTSPFADLHHSWS